MTNTSLRVLVFHNIVAPYRLPLFDRLAQDCTLAVLFGQERPADRVWTVSLEDVRFRYRVLRGRSVGPLILSFGLFRALRTERPEVVIHADSDENLVTLLIFFLLRPFLRFKLALWVEHVPSTAASLRVTRESRSRIRWPLSRAALAIMRSVRKVAYKNCDELLSLSGPASDTFIASQKTTRPVHTSTQVVPASLLGSRELAHNSSSEKIRILYLGYFRPNKNIVALINAYKAIASTEAELVIAGDGPELRALTRAAAGDPSIRFVGYVEGAAKASLIGSSDLLVLPAFFEPWGLVVNEALYYGTPVMCGKDVAASTLILDAVNGLLFDPGSPGDLERVLRVYLTDAGLRNRLDNNARLTDGELVSGIERGLAPFRECLKSVGSSC